MKSLLLAAFLCAVVAAPGADAASTRASGPSLALIGSCPGPVQLHVTGATPSDRVGFIHGLSGTMVRSQPPCPGIVLPRHPVVGPVKIADANGEVLLGVTVPPGACGRVVVALDVASCQVSNSITL